MPKTAMSLLFFKIHALSDFRLQTRHKDETKKKKKKKKNDSLQEFISQLMGDIAIVALYDTLQKR